MKPDPFDCQEFHELCMDYRGAGYLGRAGNITHNGPQLAYEKLQAYCREVVAAARLAGPDVNAIDTNHRTNVLKPRGENDVEAARTEVGDAARPGQSDVPPCEVGGEATVVTAGETALLSQHERIRANMLAAEAWCEGTTPNEKRLRRLLAVRVGLTYGDDGELQSSEPFPPIDFKRDTVEEIEEKIQQRGLAALKGHATDSNDRTTVRTCPIHEVKP